MPWKYRKHNPVAVWLSRLILPAAVVSVVVAIFRALWNA